MALVLTFIFAFILKYVILTTNGQQLNLDVNSSCRLSNGDNGVCKRADLCASAKEMLMNRQQPIICRFDKILSLIPIVCCVPGDDLPLNPSVLLVTSFNQYNFTKLPAEVKSEEKSKSRSSIGSLTRQLISSVERTESATSIPDDRNKNSIKKCDEYKSRIYPSPTLIRNSSTTSSTTTARSNDTFGILVVGGKDSKPRQFPHVALLGYGDPNDIQWLCGGALISDEFVLTAAHCLSSKEYGPLKFVRLGDLDIKSNADDAHPRQYEIVETFEHPEYRSDQKYHDVALIRLDSKIDFNAYIKPACLHEEKELPNVRFVVAGWGQTSFGGDSASILQNVEMNATDHEKCSKTYTKRSNGLDNGLIKDIQFCAEGAMAGGDTCQGDSGAPLQFIERGSTLHKIVGITSFGMNCGLVPGVYTRVSYYVPWIEGIVWT